MGGIGTVGHPLRDPLLQGFLRMSHIGYEDTTGSHLKQESDL